MKTTIRFTPWILIILAALLIFSSSCYKATISSFTHDESYTYNHFVITPVYDIVTYQFVSPNNHLLNTLLMKVGTHLFGPLEIVLRLPNLLALLGFLVFSFLILRKLDPWLALPLFVVIACNPYLLDFFALARGNGLSYGFLMGSLFFLLNFCETGRLSRFAWSATLALFGVLSHFTLIYYFVALVAAANGYLILQRHVGEPSLQKGYREFLRINAIALGAIILLALCMTGPVIKMVKAGQLFYGGETGFWHDTVGTLAETFCYGASYATTGILVLKVLTGLVFLSIAMLFLWVVLKREPLLYRDNRELWMVFMILAFAVAANVIQFYLLGTKLPIRRYGLFYYPLFMLCLAFLLAMMNQTKRLKTVSYALTYLLAGAMIFHMANTFSRDTYLDWTYEKETKHVMGLLENDRPGKETSRQVNMGVTWLYEPTVNFYRTTRGYRWLKEVTRDGPGIRADYYYIRRGELRNVPTAGRKIAIFYCNDQVVLLKSVK